MPMRQVLVDLAVEWLSRTPDREAANTSVDNLARSLNSWLLGRGVRLA